MDARGNMVNEESHEEILIGEEERIRHDALFYSQSPDDGLLLSGERARSLFIKSKLPLPELSKIWKLSDVTRDNMLDEGEFVVAMHLIQKRLCGCEIPESISTTVRPKSRPLIIIAQASENEIDSYAHIFTWLREKEEEHLSSEVVLKLLSKSSLPRDVLARIWDLSDVDRDGRINRDELYIAIHLTRFCKNSCSDLTGSIDVLSILPKKSTEESIQEKRRRRTEYQTEIRKLISLRYKLKSELINAKTSDNQAAKKKIQCELDVVSRELDGMEAKETKVRDEIYKMNTTTSITTNIEVLRPFDRSFLMKKQSSGADFLKQINFHAGDQSKFKDIKEDIFLGDNIIDFAQTLRKEEIINQKDHETSKDTINTNTNKSTERVNSKELNFDQLNSEELNSEKVNSEKDNSTQEKYSYSSDDESEAVEVPTRQRKWSKHKQKPLKVEKEISAPLMSEKNKGEVDKSTNTDVQLGGVDSSVNLGNTLSKDSSRSENEHSGDVKKPAITSRERKLSRKRSKGALDALHKVFSSSDSEGHSGKVTQSHLSVTGSKKGVGLQKSPWRERREILNNSSISDSLEEQDDDVLVDQVLAKNSLTEVSTKTTESDEKSDEIEESVPPSFEQNRIRQEIAQLPRTFDNSDENHEILIVNHVVTEKPGSVFSRTEKDHSEASSEKEIDCDRSFSKKEVNGDRSFSEKEVKDDISFPDKEANKVEVSSVPQSTIRPSIDLIDMLEESLIDSEGDFGGRDTSGEEVVEENITDCIVRHEESRVNFDLLDLLEETSFDGKENEVHKEESIESKKSRLLVDDNADIDEDGEDGVVKLNALSLEEVNVLTKNEDSNTNEDGMDLAGNKGRNFVPTNGVVVEEEVRPSKFRIENQSDDDDQTDDLGLEANMEEMSDSKRDLLVGKVETRQFQNDFCSGHFQNNSPMEKEDNEMEITANETADISFDVDEALSVEEARSTHYNGRQKEDGSRIDDKVSAKKNTFKVGRKSVEKSTEEETVNDNEDSHEEQDTKKAKMVLKSKKGRVVRSKSLGLRSRTEPDKISYVEECEWLDGLVVAELEAAEQKRNAELKSPTPASPWKVTDPFHETRVNSRKNPIEYSRSETIDEAALNLDDSRQLVKGLLDMEIAYRNEGGDMAQLRKKIVKRVRDKEFMARRRSLPIDKDMIRAGEVFEMIESQRKRNAAEKLNQEEAVMTEILRRQRGKRSEEEVDSTENLSRPKTGPNRSENEALITRILPTVVDAPKEESNQFSSRKGETSRNSHHSSDPKVVKDTPNDRNDKEPSKIDFKVFKTDEDNQELPSAEIPPPQNSLRVFKEMFESATTARPLDKTRNSTLGIQARPSEATKTRSLGDSSARPKQEKELIHGFDKRKTVESSLSKAKIDARNEKSSASEFSSEDERKVKNKLTKTNEKSPEKEAKTKFSPQVTDSDSKQSVARKPKFEYEKLLTKEEQIVAPISKSRKNETKSIGSSSTMVDNCENVVTLSLKSSKTETLSNSPTKPTKKAETKVVPANKFVSDVKDGAEDTKENLFDIRDQRHGSSDTEEQESRGRLKSVGQFKELFEKLPAKGDRERPLKSEDEVSPSDVIKMAPRRSKSFKHTQNKAENVEDKFKSAEPLKNIVSTNSKECKVSQNGKAAVISEEANIGEKSENTKVSRSNSRIDADDNNNCTEDEHIPSIKDRLVLFQTEKVGPEDVVRREVKSRKDRPKSYHGSSFNEDTLVENKDRLSSSKCDVISQSSKRYDANAALDGCDERDERLAHRRGSLGKLGGMMLGTSDVPRGSKATVSNNASPKVSAKENVAMITKSNGVDEHVYRRLAKDDRIRRELEEQELRVLEIRQRLKSTEQKLAGNDTDNKLDSMTALNKPKSDSVSNKPKSAVDKSRPDLDESNPTSVFDKLKNSSESERPRLTSVSEKIKALSFSGQQKSGPVSETLKSSSVKSRPSSVSDKSKPSPVRNKPVLDESESNSLPDRRDSGLVSAKSEVFGNSSLKPKKSNFSNAGQDGSFDKAPSDNSGLQPDNRLLVKNDRVRKEIEEQERRENELKQRTGLGVRIAKPDEKSDVNDSDAIKIGSPKKQVQKKSVESSKKLLHKPEIPTDGAIEKTHPEEKTEKLLSTLKGKKIPSKIELELEEERRREQELLNERKRREEEQNQVIEAERKRLEMIEAEKLRIAAEEEAKKHSVVEEKMKRQARTRGLRAMFETA